MTDLGDLFDSLIRPKKLQVGRESNRVSLKQKFSKSTENPGNQIDLKIPDWQ